MPKDPYVMRKAVVGFLTHIRETENKIGYLESRISKIRARLTGMGYDPSAQGGGGSRTDAIPEGVATLSELEDEWSACVRHHTREVEAAREMCALPHVERHVVWLRVVEKRKWHEVAKAVRYTPRQAQRLEQDGIEELYPLIPEQFRRDAFPNAAPL